MNNLDQQLKTFQEKLQQLVKQYQTLEKENAKLKEELGQKLVQNQMQQQQITLLQQQLDSKQLFSTALSTEQKLSLHKRIDAYLKEIDKCLSLLNG